MPRTAALLVLLLAASLTEAAGKPRVPAQHGAIAYQRDSGRYGYAIDRANARDARREALRQCDEPRCEVMLEIKDGCGALARGARRLAAAKGTTRAEAETRARNKCGADCEPVVWACTR